MLIESVTDIPIRRQISQSFGQMNRNLERLASGRRLVSGADGPAALAISERLRAQIGSLEQASRNVDHGVSLGQLADSALANQGELLGRMQELAIQSANGTLGDEERAAIQQEYGELSAEVDRIAATTTWGETQVLDGGSHEIQVGTSGGAGATVAISTPASTMASMGLSGVNLLTAQDAASALGPLQDAMGAVAHGRGTVGASINRLESTHDTLAATREHTAAAYSRMANADVATETSQLALNRNRLRAGVAILEHGGAVKGQLLSRLL